MAYQQKPGQTNLGSNHDDLFTPALEVIGQVMGDDTEGCLDRNHRHWQSYGFHLAIAARHLSALPGTRHEAAPFGDLTPYLSANLNQVLGSGPDFTNFSLTPGVRFFLGWHTYFITGVVAPVTNPKPFLQGFTAVISRGW